MSVVIYFSRAGENLINGEIKDIQKGNTEYLAKKIADYLGIDAYPIIPLLSYPFSYKETILVAEGEKKNQHRPRFHELSVDLTQEKVIFLGFPNWCGSCPLIILSFLESLNLEGKTVYPFCTHEGSYFGQSLVELVFNFPELVIKSGLPVRGSRVLKSDEAIKNWLLFKNLKAK